MSPAAMSQERGRGRYNGGGGNGHRTEQHDRPSGKGSRPGNMGRPSGGNKHDRPNNNGVRPGNNGNRHDRPNNGYRPGHNEPHRPGASNGFRPGHEHGWRPPYHAVAPRPPHMHHRPWARPVPPPHFRPRPGGPRLSAILGVTLGTALNISLNALMNGGYNVTGYGPSAVYLNGVNYFDCYWPDVTFNYNNSRFCNGEFVYSTYGYDRSRYNRLFQLLTTSYGAPVSSSGNNGSMTSTWWGYNNGYITLSYFPDYANNGRLRYYTVLSLGN